MTKRIAIALPKGGVGKTTTAINLSASLAKAEKKTLLIDLDPSGTCTSSMGFKNHELKGDIFQVFSFTKLIDNVIHKTELPNLDFIPCSINSVEIEERISKLTNNIYLFDNFLNQVTSTSYGFIILDCPPYLRGLTTIALSAANSVLLPIRAGYYSILALLKMLSHIKWVKEKINRNLEIEGILYTMYEPNTKAWDLTEKGVNKYFENHRLKTKIPKNVSLTLAEFYRKPSVLIDPSSKGSIAYSELAQEIIGRLNKPLGLKDYLFDIN